MNKTVNSIYPFSKLSWHYQPNYYGCDPYNTADAPAMRVHIYEVARFLRPGLYARGVKWSS